MLESRKIGTSELVLELKSHFPSANIAKFDKDEITTQKKLTTLLKNFNENKIDIIVGTQMLSKGHDYHNVSLAIIMGLDEHLDYSDYQARSKSLALAMQVAGRAGRADHGKVIIQGLKCEFFAKYMDKFDQFTDWAIELQSLAQAGLTYGHDKFDLERYQRIREIATEMMTKKNRFTHKES